jgi:hypothetical protein
MISCFYVDRYGEGKSLALWHYLWCSGFTPALGDNGNNTSPTPFSPPAIEHAIQDNDLTVASVLSGSYQKMRANFHRKHKKCRLMLCFRVFY